MWSQVTLNDHHGAISSARICSLKKWTSLKLFDTFQKKTCYNSRVVTGWCDFKTTTVTINGTMPRETKRLQHVVPIHVPYLIRTRRCRCSPLQTMTSSFFNTSGIRFFQQSLNFDSRETQSVPQSYCVPHGSIARQRTWIFKLFFIIYPLPQLHLSVHFFFSIHKNPVVYLEFTSTFWFRGVSQEN